MPGLPENLYFKCRQVLLSCDQFSSSQRLRAIFITEELFPFRLGLKQADHPDELVDLCMEYLLEKRLTGGRPVFPIFLSILSQYYEPGDELRDNLIALSQAVKAAMAPPEPQSKPTSRTDKDLFDLLLQLDFSEQVKLFKRVLQNYSVAAFLVHGKPACGQQSLINRLLRSVSGWETAKRIRVDLNSNGIGKSSRALWYQLACHLQVPDSSRLPEIVPTKVSEWLETQNVIFLFYGVDYMPSACFSELIQKFWHPLVERIQQQMPRGKPQKHLVLFLVGYVGYEDKGQNCYSDELLASQLNHSAYPKLPLVMPPVGFFPPDIMDSWLDCAIAAKVLPSGLTAQMLLEECDNGVPLFVYEKICHHCGYRWEGGLAKWLE